MIEQHLLRMVLVMCLGINLGDSFLLRLVQVGGLREIDTLRTNPDTLFKTGIWGYNVDAYNTSIPINYGLLIVYSAYNSAQGGQPVAQECIGHKGEVYVRLYWIDGWSEWVRL